MTTTVESSAPAAYDASPEYVAVKSLVPATAESVTSQVAVVCPALVASVAASHALLIDDPLEVKSTVPVGSPALPLTVAVRTTVEPTAPEAASRATVAVASDGACHVTESSVDVDAVLGFDDASCAAPAATDATTVPLVVIPDTSTVKTDGPPETTATSVPPAVDPDSTTSEPSNPDTGSLNVAVNTTGDTDVGSA
jgi:hypothetical protein